MLDAYLSFLLVEVVDDDSDEEVEGEEGAEDDEDDEVQVHVEIDLFDWLLLHLQQETSSLKKHLTCSRPIRSRDQNVQLDLLLFSFQLQKLFHFYFYLFS